MDADLHRVMDNDGNLIPGAVEPAIPDADLVKLFRGMLQLRLVDERMLKLQRQGRMGFYLTSFGEEATQYGSVYPLAPGDWIFPCYREPGVAFWRGYTLYEYCCQLFGNSADPIKGRQMPVHHAIAKVNYASVSSPVGTQIPQAVGVGLAAQVRKTKDLAITYFGDGATSTGAFHVALNMAGVRKVPVIFLLRNNGWAISTPGHRQTGSKTFAQKAIAYGMVGERVDGNDILAMISRVGAAAARARAGEGATLIEAVTYRRGAHSSSDDPSVYRDPAEPAQWEASDPLLRFERYLVRKKLLSADMVGQMRDEIVAEIGDALRRAEEVEPRPPLESMFEEVYAETPAHLTEQHAELRQVVRTTPRSHH